MQGKFSNYIGKFCHVTTSLWQGLLPHVQLQRPWERGCGITAYMNSGLSKYSGQVSNYKIVIKNVIEIMLPNAICFMQWNLPKEGTTNLDANLGLNRMHHKMNHIFH